MTIQTKLIIAAAAALIATLSLTTLISSHKLRSLERNIEQAKQHTDELERQSHTAETKASEYKHKIEYLEGELAAIASVARKQNEELKAISGDVGAARRDVERARTIRAIDTTTDQLCARLAGLGYPC